MIWQLCIQYANGTERVLRSFQHRENALKWVDILYNVNGYPLHYAYVVRHQVASQQAASQQAA